VTVAWAYERAHTAIGPGVGLPKGRQNAERQRLSMHDSGMKSLPDRVKSALCGIRIWIEMEVQLVYL
jgi:hypothetical protein